ncbi:golgin IMH1 isoform X3 [Oncorhynchus mykiss]|uniref:golgin IMH1 isoform X3 n=1 Tax=Oncorhynchus mykiss TaxID=8022 RepID=UPI00187851D4|nr:golgin IMH1 isoform X3 [Oncorhynchus mykiss]
MLRRTVSFPIEAGRLQQLGLLDCASHGVTSCSVLDLPSLHRGHRGSRQREDEWQGRYQGPAEAGQWEDERQGRYQGPAEAGQWEDDGGLVVTPSSNGSTRGPRWKDLYTSSDQLRSSEERRDVLAELVYSRSRLKQLNSELQRTVEVADDNNTLLRTENTALRNQVKGMKQSIHDAEQLMDELEEIRSLLVEKDDATGNLEAYIKQLEKEKEILEDQIETIGSEMSRIIPDRATDKKKIVNLSQALQALQLRLEESRLALDHRDEVLRKKDFVVEQLGQSLTEYSSIAQDLKEKMKDLQSQLAEALINGGEGGYMSLDGTLSAATQRSISLAEELGLLPCMMEDSSDEVQREEKIEEEQRVEERVERQADEKKEEVVKEEKQMLEEKSGVWSDMVRGVRAAGGFTLGFLVPLGVLVSMVPGCYDHCTGLGFTNTFWSTARYLIQPYCNVHHIGLPPL